MSDRFDTSFTNAAGMGMAIHSSSQKLTCLSCGTQFTKECDLWRHLRIPIPCQILDCPKKFRDDKLKVYLNHHASEHNTDVQNGLTEANLKSYFREKGKEFRHRYDPNRCVNETSNRPQSGIGLFGDTPGAATALSTGPRNGFSSYSTVHADLDPPLPCLSTPETSIGSSPLAPTMDGLLNSSDVLLSSSQSAQLGTGLDYVMENTRLRNPYGHVPYLKEQILSWRNALSRKRHYSVYLRTLLTENLMDEQSLEVKIKDAEEELDKISHATESESQALSDDQFTLDAFVHIPRGQSEG